MRPVDAIPGCAHRRYVRRGARRIQEHPQHRAHDAGAGAVFDLLDDEFIQQVFGDHDPECRRPASPRGRPSPAVRGFMPTLPIDASLSGPISNWTL